MPSTLLSLGLALALSGQAPSGHPYPALESLCERSVLNRGDLSRLHTVFARAERGEPVVVGVIGGSITEGAAAGKPEHRWGNQMCQWWRSRFPKARVSFHNAGIGATGSAFAVHRLRAHLLDRQPDVVVVEFSVNDPANHGEQYEGVIRQILLQPNSPAVLGLHMMSQNGNNVEAAHLPVLRHYALPSISYRAALWPLLADGSLEWSDLSPDTIHPNAIGHTYAAGLVCAFLERELKAWRADGAKAPDALTPLPAQPLHGSRFDDGEMLDLSQVRVVTNQGFTCELIKGYARYGYTWHAEKPGSRLTLEVEGPLVSILYSRLKRPLGRAVIRVDGKQVCKLEAFHAQWWTYTPVQEILRDAPGKHLVDIEVLNEKDPKSEGYGFELRGLMRAFPRTR